MATPDRDRPPLVDLHRHLEGSIRPATYEELTGRPGARQAIEVAAPLSSLAEYLTLNDEAVGVLTDVDVCARVAREAVEDAAAEGLDRLELRFSPGFMARPHGLEAAAVAEAVVDGAGAAARDTGLPVALIGIMSRTFGPAAAARELDALLTVRDRIVALDLAGDEARWPGELFTEHFARGRAAGWRVTVHAGEAAGAAGVRFAIERLGAERIGHGVRAVEDPRVLDLLAERGVALEVSLSSNLHTGTVPDLAAHPVAAIAAHGVAVALCTDNPTASRTTLARELEQAAPAAGLNAAGILRARLDSEAHAFTRA